MTSSSSGFVPAPLVPARARFRPAGRAPAAESEAVAAEAEGMLAMPTEEQDVSYRQGFEAGLAKGREEGVEAARAELPIEDAEVLRAAARAFDEAARGVAALQRGYWAENRKVVVKLALAVAERLLRRELATDAQALTAVVERACEALGDQPPARICVAPELAEALAGGATDLSELARRHGLEVEADARLAPGDVRVLAERASVDARISESLRRIGEELVEVAERTAAPQAPSEEGPQAASEEEPQTPSEEGTPSAPEEEGA